MYYEHFDLKKDPFSLTPDTHFYCQFPSHEEALETMLYTVKAGQSFCLVYGEVGVGKTMLCRKLLERLEEEDICACFIFNPNTPIDALQAAIAIELGIENTDEKQTVFEQINQKLLQNAESGKETVLVIDEGQSLSDECLEFIRSLTNLETASRKLLQIIVFAQPELVDRLQQPHLRQLAQRFGQSCELLPLGNLRMSSYISERLVSAGHQHGHILSSKAMKTLWSHTRGNPRLINSLMSKSLLSAYVGGKKKVGAKDVKRAAKESKIIFCQGKIKEKRKFTWTPIFILTYAAVVTALLLLVQFGWMNHL